MKKRLTLTLLAFIAAIASHALVPLTGVLSTCVGSSTYLYEDTTYTGGTWSSSNASIATVVAGTFSGFGMVTGISAGVCTISYTLGGVSVTASYTVNPVPTAISGPTSGCPGPMGTLVDATPGGTWSSSNPSVMTVGASTGVITGIATGTVFISYTVGGCSVDLGDTVLSGSTPAAITGPSMVCSGYTITLADATSGGTWSSSSTSTATVSSSGVVTGVAAGTVTITYSTPGGSCGGSSYATHSVTVSAGGAIAAISGASTVPVGSTITLTDATAGGSWESGDYSIATVDGSTGVVTGVAPGAVVISYFVITSCDSGWVYDTITVTPIDRISGHVTFTPDSLDSGYLKVWLITYAPGTHILAASDSVTIYMPASSAFYQFLGEPADSYRVKAAYYPATYTGTGYIPTYHTASFYWNSADVFYHASGATDDSKNIAMAYGSVTAGAGFIGGDVTMGANRGTSTSVPSVGVLVYVLNSAGQVLQMTTTDATGQYAFHNLPVGATYSIYPEAINYHTVAYTGINLTAAAPSVSAANFDQHSISLGITPVTAGIRNVTSSASSVIAFPNPTNGKLNVQWNENTTEKGTITLTDITGRVVYTSSVNMTEGAGSCQVNLSGLTNGIYFMSIQSASINYNNKIELQH